MTETLTIDSSGLDAAAQAVKAAGGPPDLYRSMVPASWAVAHEGLSERVIALARAWNSLREGAAQNLEALAAGLERVGAAFQEADRRAAAGVPEAVAPRTGRGDL
ncbi:MAG: hypothetical protein LBK42_12035 [Propionibacteriaceae bacterium]|nr:hypothetical protein [Propionibacteriaceae bacterium]